MAWKTVTYRWQWLLKSSPAQLWPYVADTQRFNRAAGLPSIDFTEMALDTGGSRRFAQTSRFGVTIKYEDFPFEWIKEREFSSMRIFEFGPLARTYARVRLEPHQLGTRLYYDVDVTPANLLGRLGIPYQLGWQLRRSFDSIFRQIDHALQNQQPQVFSLPVTPLTPLAQTRLQSLSHNLVEQGYSEAGVQQLGELIIRESDFELSRLRPYILADSWQAPRLEILELFLAAAKIGLLQMQWDVMCPLCRGVKYKALSLDQVRKGVHCSTCNIDFEANFSDNVELTFRPHSQIRSVDEASYCFGGPMVTPHILLHQTIAPGETRRLEYIHLDGDGVRLRTQVPGVEQWLHVTPSDTDGVDTVSVGLKKGVIHLDVTDNGHCSIYPDKASYQAAHHPAASEASQPDVSVQTLTISNQTSIPQQFYIERAGWYNNAVTATRVTALQKFRDLFSHEVLRPGEKIGIQGMTLLFSDLVGSTAMYNRWGDAASYSLVREQFAFLQRIVRTCGGAIVKTIGDAIMAAFADPVDAVRAALAIQKELYAFNAQHSEALTIRLGVHYGPCIAVNLNDRLDYFGTTVNLAARMEGQSRGNDVVMSEAVRCEPGVVELLAAEPVTVTQFATSIKGFDDHFCLYRVQYAGEVVSVQPVKVAEHTKEEHNTARL
ncbi:MAG: adenylate/guanylate cyclase domain-containing protein [Anaerolineae bacterium]|nr:adenylate/guanylate cyclase domain-containing protein [Anaerolineae bacterium]